MEFKEEHDPKIEESAVRYTLGYSGNERLRNVHDMYADYWIGTSDISQKLDGVYITTKINLKKFRVELTIPETFEEYVHSIKAQWNYGYSRGHQSLTSSIPNSKRHIRNINLIPYN